jgi:hypothetical protein
VVDGLTIINGYASAGGGIYVGPDGGPTITRCTITGCRAESAGGGIYYRAWGDITYCTISGNSAGIYGGGIYCTEHGPSKIANCRIVGNSAGDAAGPGESAGGGGIACLIGVPPITNCVISGNAAVGDAAGGGIASLLGYVVASNCTLVGNSASTGGGIYAVISMSLTNSILWDNTATVQGPQIALEGGSPSTASYNDIQGGSGGVYDPSVTLTWGAGNIDLDPAFADAEHHLGDASPCLNTGDPGGDYTGQTDIDGDGRTNGRVDIGADEYWDRYFLTVTIPDGGGTVGVDPPGPYDPDPPAEVLVSAKPAFLFSFVKWEGDYPPGQQGEPNLVLTMDESKELEAYFKCGSSPEAVMPPLLGMLVVLWAARRRT